MLIQSIRTFLFGLILVSWNYRAMYVCFSAPLIIQIKFQPYKVCHSMVFGFSRTCILRIQ